MFDLRPILQSYVHAMLNVEWWGWLIILSIPLLKIYQYIRKRWRGR